MKFLSFKPKFIFISLFSFIELATSKINNENINKLYDKLSYSSYEDKAVAIQIGANNPCEDKYFIYNITLKNIPGIFMTVLDGHGGGELSTFASTVMYPYFLEAFNENILEINFDKRIIAALNKAYLRIEEEFLYFAYFKYSSRGADKYNSVGSCSLSAVVINNKIYVANLGDSKARLFIQNEDLNNKKNKKNSIDYLVKKVSKVFNARKKDEQKRLKEKWPNDTRIVKCYSQKSCYVRGRLQPTRSFGDFHLKYFFFNLVHYKKYELYGQAEQFAGPFIDHNPDIQVFEIQEKDKYLILATDGMWDDLNSKEVAKMINGLVKNVKIDKGKGTEVEKIAVGLMDKVIEKSGKRNNMQYENVLNLKLGNRKRSIHDDITIIICDLSKF